MQRIRVLLDKYYDMRREVTYLREDIQSEAKKITQDPQIVAFLTTHTSREPEWQKALALQAYADVPPKMVTLTQLERALQAKWKGCRANMFGTNAVETVQRIHETINSTLSSGIRGIDEVLCNVSLESSLLRDVDILSPKSIPILWRGISLRITADLDASLKRSAGLEETVMKKIRESEKDLKCARQNLDEIPMLEREAKELETLFENVL